MKRKMLLLLMTAVLAVTFLMAACQAQAKKTATEETMDAAQSPTTEEMVLEEVKILCRSHSADRDPSYRFQENPRWEQIPMVEKFYGKLAQVGVRLEYEVIENEQYSEAVRTRLMTGVDLPDIILDPGISETEAIWLGEAGIIADVAQLLNAYDADDSIYTYWQEMAGPSITEITTEDDRIWWMPYTYHRDFLTDDGSVDPDHYDVSYHVSIRRDWLDRLQLPYKMFYTPDEFADLIIAVNEMDGNGNNLHDEVIGNFDTRFTTGFESGFDMVTGLIGIRNDGRGIQCNLYNENLPAYLAFLRKLYRADCIDTTALNGTRVVPGNRGTTIADYAGQSWEEASVTGFETTAVYSPVILDNDEGADGFSVYARDNKQALRGKWFINAHSRHMEAVMKVFDVLYTDEVAHMMTWGEEGLTYDVDETGIRIRRMVDGEDWDPTILTCRGMIGNNALPNVYDCRETRQEYFRSQKHIDQYADKDEMIQWIYEHDQACTFQETVLPLAMITQQERQTIEALEVTLTTYIDEMIMEMVMGQRSLDDLPECIAELEQLGLQDYIGVYEARCDRWMAYAQENNLETLYN